MALSESQHWRNILAIRTRTGASPELIDQARRKMHIVARQAAIRRIAVQDLDAAERANLAVILLNGTGQ